MTGFSAAIRVTVWRSANFTALKFFGPAHLPIEFCDLYFSCLQSVHGYCRFKGNF